MKILREASDAVHLGGRAGHVFGQRAPRPRLPPVVELGYRRRAGRRRTPGPTRDRRPPAGARYRRPLHCSHGRQARLLRGARGRPRGRRGRHQEGLSAARAGAASRRQPRTTPRPPSGSARRPRPTRCCRTPTPAPATTASATPASTARPAHRSVHGFRLPVRPARGVLRRRPVRRRRRPWPQPRRRAARHGHARFRRGGLRGSTAQVEWSWSSAASAAAGAAPSRARSRRHATTCGGQGRVQRVQQTALGQFVQTGACPTCGGRGVIIADPCRELPGPRPHRHPADGGGADSGRDHGRPAAAHARPRPPGRAGRASGRPVRGRSGGRRPALRARRQRYRGGARRARSPRPPWAPPHHRDARRRAAVELKAGTSPATCWCCAERACRRLSGRGRGDHRISSTCSCREKLDDAQRRLLEEFEPSAGAEAYARDESFLGRSRAASR